jgi:UDP-N-acetylglucosamine 2-epimerase (non-hydrolysing)
MRIMSIFGTRPEIIRLTRVFERLDRQAEHIMVHTGQNYAENLSDIFLRDLRVRRPDHFIDSKSPTVGQQIAKILTGVEALLEQCRPDRVLILGDTNSALATIIAERRGIPVYHMEAGNRCWDRKVPEEINRRLVDAIASHALPYTPGSRENLIRDGIDPRRIFVSGNPIAEVLGHYNAEIEASQILSKLDLQPSQYFAVTAHRAENVDIPKRLASIVAALEQLHQAHSVPVVFSVHPRTREKLRALPGWREDRGVRYVDAMGFFDFVKLEKEARLMLSDSGTVQEECCLFRVPTVTIRDTTERPETVECGSNLVCGLDTDAIVAAANVMLQSGRDWRMPIGYADLDVSERVARYLLAHRYG